MIDWVKKYWPLVAVIGFLIAFSSRLQAMYQAPQDLKETNKAVQKLASSLDLYAAKKEIQDEKQDKIIELLTQASLNRRNLQN